MKTTHSNKNMCYTFFKPTEAQSLCIGNKKRNIESEKMPDLTGNQTQDLLVQNPAS